MMNSPESDSLGQSTGILQNNGDSALFGRPQLAGFGFENSNVGAVAPEACIVTEHPIVMFFGAIIAICGFGLLAYGFMS